MELPENLPFGLEAAGQATRPLFTRHLRRDLLRLEERLPLAVLAE